MADVKQVKVDNWGVFFVQRLKHFFNNTDYCDLTLQFRDYSQLKVHRLVLSACTKYFEALERMCEVYDDCLIMPDDLQADVVVPIVNFMYTGQLEYNCALFDRLYCTARIMNMPVLTKLLDAQRSGAAAERDDRDVPYPKSTAHRKTSDPIGGKRAKPAAGDEFNSFDRVNVAGQRKYGPGPRLKYDPAPPKPDPARPTRYELPEGLEADEFFGNSFSNISYESEPFAKPTKGRRSEDLLRNEASSSDKFDELRRNVKRARVSPSPSDATHASFDRIDDYPYAKKSRSEYPKSEAMSDDDNVRDAFDSLIEYDRADSGAGRADDFPTETPKVPGKADLAKNSNISIDHAKIISEVLKKYPHLVKTNRNIKLKIMSGKSSANTSSHNYVLETNNRGRPSGSGSGSRPTGVRKKEGEPSWVYIPRTGNSESVARLIALGAENTTGPWLCLLCGTPAKALKFLTYRAYYRHLADVHREKIPPKICEYCGFKSGKRNHLLHHMYTKHDIEPPPHYYFPKCNQCSYIALTEAFLIKHKMSHADNKDFKCVICNASFKTRPQLLLHIQNTGHKISPDRRGSAKCVYCNKIFLREANLYAHLKISHKTAAKRDGIIDNSDEEDDNYSHSVGSYNYASDQQEEHVEIKEEYGGKIQIVSQGNKLYNKPRKLLNTKFIDSDKEKLHEYESMDQFSKDSRSESVRRNVDREGGSGSNSSNANLVDRIVVFNDNEYIIQTEEEDSFVDHAPKDRDNATSEGEFIIPDVQVSDVPVAQTRTSHANKSNASKRPQQARPVQIVMENNQQYKTIAPAGSIIFANSKQIPENVKFISDQYDNIQLENAQEDEVMVLNEEDFQIACSESISNDGSNIVVVYSHPVDKQYISVENRPFDNITDPNEIETQLAKVHGETVESAPAPAPSERGVVHETVETWQEETVVESQSIEDDGIANLPGSEQQKCLEPSVLEIDTLVKAEKPDMEIDSAPISETVIPVDERPLDLPVDDSVEISLNSDVSECPDSTTDQNCPPDVTEETQKDVEETTVLTDNNAHDYASQSIVDSDAIPPIVHATNNINEIANEWSDEDTSSRKEQTEENALEEDKHFQNDECVDNNILTESSEIQNDKPIECIEHLEHNEDLEKNHVLQENVEPKEENGDVPSNPEFPCPEIVVDKTIIDNDVSEENLRPSPGDRADAEVNYEVSDALKEVEESIENIQEEINKQELASEPETRPPTTVEIAACENKTDETLETEQILIEDHIRTDTVEDDKKESVEKVSSVEKISHLLTEWEDTDSQSEVLMVADNKDSTNVTSNSNIEKLVSDWDDEDEK